jgi:heparosan-N-sulfate-glucuronate 5-epimerase
MPRKEWRLLARDLSFYATGRSDCAAADWTRDNWLYPLDWGYQLDRPDDYFTPFDGDGLPMREIPGAIPKTYLPSRIAAYALANWNRLDRDATARARFLNCADWFAVQPGGAFRHDFPLVGMDAGWLSCIAQGEAMSVLVRAYRLTTEARFAEASRAAAVWLHRPVGDGGVLDHLSDGHMFVEEYPGSPYRHVLNGCLYALTGLSDQVRAGLDDDGADAGLLNAVLDSISVHLDRWVVAGWTTYDYQSDDQRAAGVPGNPNTLTYQTLHWILLDHLGRMHERPKLVDAAAQWRRSAGSLPRRIGALVNKLRYRLHHGYRT